MTMTKIRSLDHSLQTTKEWLSDLQQQLNIDNEQQAYTALRAVLHALRDRLTVQEATDFAAQLPMVLGGVYFHEYNPSGKPEKIRKKEDFLAKVERELANQPVDAEAACRAAFTVFSKRMTEGAINDVKSDLPQDIRELWP